MRTVIVILVLLAVGAVGLSSLFVVDQTHYAVQMRFGRPVQILIEPGLYTKLPWPIETVERFDNRLMLLEQPSTDQPEKEFLTEDANSGIGKNVVVSTYTCWRIKRSPEAVIRFLETMRDIDGAAARLSDVVVAELGAALGENDFSVLVSTDPQRRDWEGLLEQVRERCAARVEAAYGIEIVDVRIKRLNFPEQNRRNVFDRMRAERDTIAARYRSEGEEQATAIRAAANQKREELQAMAYEQTQKIRGEADAKAARIYGQAYGADPEFYAFTRTLEAYETTLNDRTVAILSAGSDFLRLLNKTSRFGAFDPNMPIVLEHDAD